MLNFYLRSWQIGDEDSLFENANNKNVSHFLQNTFPQPYTYQDALDWINFAHSQAGNFAIVVNERAVGGIGIVLKENIHCRNAEIGYWIGEPYWGQGIMTKAVQETCDFAFKNFAINRIYAGIFDQNLASMQVLKKGGFHLEAILKQSIYKEGNFWDEHIFVKFR